MNMETENECSENSDVKRKSPLKYEEEEGELIEPDVENVGLGAVTDVPEHGRSILRASRDPQVWEKRHQNREGAFITGINVFEPTEQAKLGIRAKRFNLDPSEIKPLTVKKLKCLYKNMGVKAGDGEKDIRLDAIHLLGVETMSTHDVFSYFKEYGPASLEWITSNSCNVVWLDEVSAARAMLGLSVRITGLKSPNDTRSLDGSGDVEMASASDSSEEEEELVTAIEIPFLIPPGFWRRGVSNDLAEWILLRFATIHDRKQPRSFNSAGLAGLTSESRKRRMAEGGSDTLINQSRGPIFDDVGDETLLLSKNLIDKTDSSTNPWGAIAQQWGSFEKTKKIRSDPPLLPVLEHRFRGIPDLRSQLACGDLPPNPRRPPPELLLAQRRLRPPLWRAGRERERSMSSPEGEWVKERAASSSPEGEWGSRDKAPRMRMYADDEPKPVQQKLVARRRSRSREIENGGGDLRSRLSQRRWVGGGDEGGPRVYPDLRLTVGQSPRRDSSSENEDADYEELRAVLSRGRGRARAPGGGEDSGSSSEEEFAELRVAVPVTEESQEEKPKIGANAPPKCVLKGARSESDDELAAQQHTSLLRSSRKHALKTSSHRLERGRDREGNEVDLRLSMKQRTLQAEDYDSDEVVCQDAPDLRSKLSKELTKIKRPKKPVRSKSPLQIEIDNDEYYRLIGSD